MPKRPSTVVVMGTYPPLSSREWYMLVPRSVRRVDQDSIEFDIQVVAEPKQFGRIVKLELPAVLAPGSPLMKFLDEGFGIQLGQKQPFDLNTLFNQVLEGRFSKYSNGQPQTIVAFRTHGSLD